MAINPSQSFHFKNFSDFQSESPHLNTNALLRQGHMNVGGVRYHVSLSLDNKLSVSREPHQSKMGRFFNGMSDMFKHRLADDATTSRSQRIAEGLNYRRSIETRYESLRSNSKASSPGSSASASPAASRKEQQAPGHLHHHHSASASQGKVTLTLDDFMRQEEERASYHGESVSENLAKEAYDRYLQENKPAPIKRTKSEPSFTQAAPKKAERNFDDFMREENERANYHGESPRRENAQEAFSHYQTSLRPQSRNSRISPEVPKPSSETKTSSFYDHHSEMDRIKNTLGEADYYGTHANVSKWEQRLVDAESPSRHENVGLRRHQSAPSVLQSHTPAAKTPGRREQLYQSIQSNIRNLPSHEQQVPKQTLNLFTNILSRLTSKSQREVLSHIRDAMALPAGQRDHQLKQLQQMLREMTGARS